MKGYNLPQGFGLSNFFTVVLLIFGHVSFVNAQQTSIKIDRSGQYGL